MRVFVLVNQVSSDQSGLWESAARGGTHEVVLAGARPRRDLDAYTPSAVTPMELTTEILTPVPLRPGADHLWWWYPSLRRAIRRVRPDLVHVHGELWGVPTLQAVAAHPRVVAHGADNRFRFGSPLEDRVRSRVLDRQLERVLAYVSWNAAGAGLAQARRPGLPVAVLPGVAVADPGPPRPRAASRERLRVGFAGRLVPEKGLRLLLDALGAARDAGAPEFELQVVGDGPERAVAEVEWSFPVTVHGRVEHTEALAILAGCDVVAVPSMDTATWSEQYGRVAVEAMAHGVSVVVSDAGALPEVVRPGGLVVAAGDVAAWADALVTLLSHEDLRRCHAQRARAHYEDSQAPARHAKELVALWSSLDG